MPVTFQKKRLRLRKVHSLAQSHKEGKEVAEENTNLGLANSKGSVQTSVPPRALQT